MSEVIFLFFGDDGFHSMFVYQETLNTLELREGKGTMFLVGNQRGCMLLN